MAAAKALKIATKPSHPSKADTAVELAEEHGLPDVSSLMGELNDTRKASNYGDVPRPEHLDAEDIAVEIEDYVSAVEAIVKSAEEDDHLD